MDMIATEIGTPDEMRVRGLPARTTGGHHWQFRTITVSKIATARP